MNNKEYNHKGVESKWQKEWLDKKIYSPDLKKAKKPFYNLMMFPYPSAEGLHVGNMYAFTGADIYGRFIRMSGCDVFEPIGLDGFGIHSENYALKIGKHPAEQSKVSQKRFYEQLRQIGNSFDWTKTLETYDHYYYRWTQWLFIKMFKAGLAYRAKAQVNWCPSCKTVLADEQVIAGRCERCNSIVLTRELPQWFFRITKYADRLLDNLKKIDWSEKIKTAQRGWIGKSEGMTIRFKSEKGNIEVFTTRPDTLNAVTFLATSKLYEEGSKEKIGKFSGKYAIDPLSGRKLPIWDTNYVAPDYGTGIIMGVPAHDERDMEFAKKYQIDVIDKRPDKNLWSLIEKKRWGRRQTNYHLRDWLISRQRYWGPPIPMIFCENCGWIPVPEEDLPVVLPYVRDYQPLGTGVSPLATDPEFYQVKCPSCGKMARRETDVSDTFLDSSWYFLAYPNLDTRQWKEGPSAGSGQAFFDKKIMEAWLPVNKYVGGAEHAVLHLMYARFITMVLHDLKYLDFEEPFSSFYAHGLLIKDGAKMSKSRGNVVVPDEYIKKFGGDTLRCYLMFLGPYDAGGDFRDTGIEGMYRFLNRVWRLFMQNKDVVLVEAQDSREVLSKLHQTIKKVTEDIQNLRYNTAISAIMEFVNLLQDKAGGKVRRANGGIRCAEWDEALRTLCLLLAPFAPHMTEEIWTEILGEKFSVHTSDWPKFDVDLAREEQSVIVVQVDGKVRSTLSIKYQVSSIKEEIEKLAKKDLKVAKWLKGKTIKKVFFVPGKLINFVTVHGKV